MHEEQVKEAIGEAIEELNRQRPHQNRLNNLPETLLYGMDAHLDSLDLVALIVTTEQKIEDKTGIKISLANEKALSMRNSPFRSVGALQNYAIALIQERE